MFLTSLAAADWTRRRWIQAGAFSALGTTLPHWLASSAQGAGRVGRAKNVLVILEQGGMSHMDTWDPKPDVVSEHRSPYRPISTRVPGMQFTELLSKTAEIADKLSVVRSFRHPRAGADGHPEGTRYILSGAHPGSPQEMPDMGSVVSRLQGTECQYLPPYVMIPGNHEQNAQTKTGFLPAGFRVFKTGGRDLSDPKWQVSDILPRQENGSERLARRQTLLKEIDDRFSGTGERTVGGMDRFYAQAFDTLSSQQVLKAFDLQGESTTVRDRYGAGHRGACYLLGRKLIESGVRFVTVDTRWPHSAGMTGGGNLNWDHHDHIYASQTCELPGASGAGAGRYGIGHWMMMGSVDTAFSALIRDLDERGLLDETLVCFVTEFGRTPKINKHGGRDHWTHGYSMVFAGAGVPGGQLIGQTNSEGGYVLSQPYTPEDYAATVYEKLGIDRDRPLYTPANRPVYFGHMGEPIPGLV
jgi:hypothetical protein